MADKGLSAEHGHQGSSLSLSLEHKSDDKHALLQEQPMKVCQEKHDDKYDRTCMLSKEGQLGHEETTLHEMTLSPMHAADPKEGVACDGSIEDDNGREKLKRHRVEVAGRVWIPDIWGQEDLLKDWIDCSVFETSLVPSGIMSARAALVEEGRRANNTRLRIENRC